MIKRLIITSIVLLVLIIGVFFGYKYLFTPKVISENSEVVLSCSDTDGRDIYMKGTTLFKRDEPGESSNYESPDYCEPHAKYGVVLREGWCEGLVYKEIRTTCGRGSSCVDGRCS